MSAKIAWLRGRVRQLREGWVFWINPRRVGYLACLGLAAVLLLLTGFSLWVSAGTLHVVSLVGSSVGLSDAAAHIATFRWGEERVLAASLMLLPLSLLMLAAFWVALHSYQRRLDAAMVEQMQRLQREAEVEQAAIQRREARFRALIQNAADLILIAAPDGSLHYVSPAAERFRGADARTTPPAHLTDLIVGDDATAATLLLAQSLQSPSKNLMTELRLRGGDGPPRDFEVIATNLLADDGIQGVVFTCHDISERKELERELSHLAFHDVLTGLPNRALFYNRLDHALVRASRQEALVGMLFLDLDNFKLINDSLGHHVGDKLLQAIAGRIQLAVRAGDTVARLGGDEFTVLLEGALSEQTATEVAERILHALQQPVRLGEHDIFPAASIGVALGRPQHDTASSLVRNADLAMYQAKARGKSRFEVFQPSMNTVALNRLQTETDLRHALERQEFRIHYQPIVTLVDHELVELEALVRWEHPRRGLLPPDEFIPLAEETGLIVPLGQWILEEASRQVATWRAELGSKRLPVLSVNLSARQFQDPRLVENVLEVLARTGLPPEALKLEITESAAMENVATTTRTLRRLKAAGILLAIDDFGTGYASLSYLRSFPVDSIKVDRSFVSGLSENPQDAAIVQGVIALAKSLHLGVTGEGIETSDQLESLLQLGCDQGQGYFFARPLSSAAMEGLLNFNASTPDWPAA